MPCVQKSLLCVKSCCVQCRRAGNRKPEAKRDCAAYALEAQLNIVVYNEV